MKSYFTQHVSRIALGFLICMVGCSDGNVGLVSGTQALALRFRRLIPAAAAVLLVVGGCYTASGRGFAKLHSLSDIQVHWATTGGTSDGQPTADAEQWVAEIGQFSETPLPCCIGHSPPEENSTATQEGGEP